MKAFLLTPNLVIVNTLATIGAIIFGWIMLEGWRFDFFYEYLGEIKPEQSDDIMRSVENLFFIVMIPIALTSILWMVLAYKLLSKIRQSRS